MGGTVQRLLSHCQLGETRSLHSEAATGSVGVLSTKGTRRKRRAKQGENAQDTEAGNCPVPGMRAGSYGEQSIMTVPFPDLSNQCGQDSASKATCCLVGITSHLLPSLGPKSSLDID